MKTIIIIPIILVSIVTNAKIKLDSLLCQTSAMYSSTSKVVGNTDVFVKASGSFITDRNICVGLRLHTTNIVVPPLQNADLVNTNNVGYLNAEQNVTFTVASLMPSIRFQRKTKRKFKSRNAIQIGTGFFYLKPQTFKYSLTGYNGDYCQEIVKTKQFINYNTYIEFSKGWEIKNNNVLSLVIGSETKSIAGVSSFYRSNGFSSYKDDFVHASTLYIGLAFQWKQKI